MNRDDHLNLAITAAMRAAQAILDVYHGEEVEVEFKSDNSPLTRADRSSHAIIIEGLAATGLPVLSEESRAISYGERQAWSLFWLVDPLDGTKEFIRRNGEFTVNIALIAGSAPVLGVVGIPALDQVFWGVPGEGAAHRATVVPGMAGADARAAGTPLTGCPFSGGSSTPVRVVASRSHSTPETEAFIAGVEQRYGPVLRVSCGSSLKICRLVEGQADIYPRIAPTMEWDTAAAQAVLEAAGGRVVEYDPSVSAADYLQVHSPYGRPLRYNKSKLINPPFVAAR